MGFIGWRVEDATSRARKEPGGIYSGSNNRLTFTPRSAREGRCLREHMSNHLNWSNHKDTPLISVYGSWYPADREARRRVRAGMKRVVIHEIRITSPHRGWVKFRYVPKLMAALDEEIPSRAFHNAKHEFVFLHRIPRQCINRTICY